MFDAARWQSLQDGSACPHCLDLLPNAARDPGLVTDLPSGPVFLRDDADFRGYCLLNFRRHATELFQLSDPERNQLIADVSRVADAIWRVCAPGKLNYVVLGNEVPHLHVHVIPRYPEDGWWGKSIWARPDEQRRSLEPAAFENLLARLRAAMH